MRSKAHFKSHPLHPILVVFPIAFYLGTCIFDLLAVINHNLEFAVTAIYTHIAGVIGAVLAAVPGLIDFTYTVPPKSSAKKRATKHAAINSSVLIIFVIALYLKYTGKTLPAVILSMELIGAVLTLVAGWMGGTLVHRNQIGVNIRYADAGKWKELYLHGDSDRYEVCDEKELKPNQMKLVHLKDKRIVIARDEKGYLAFDDYCPHKGGSLAGGAMMCGTVQCPWHGSQFDVRTGNLKAGPSKQGIKTYGTQTLGGKVYLTL